MKLLLLSTSILFVCLSFNANAQSMADDDEVICSLPAIPDYKAMLVKFRTKLDVLQTELSEATILAHEKDLIAQKSAAAEIKSDKTASQAKYDALAAGKANAVIKMVQKRIQTIQSRINSIEIKLATLNPK